MVGFCTFKNSYRIIFTSCNNLERSSWAKIARIDGLGRPANRAVGSSGIHEEDVSKTENTTTIIYNQRTEIKFYYHSLPSPTTTIR